MLLFSVWPQGGQRHGPAIENGFPSLIWNNGLEEQPHGKLVFLNETLNILKVLFINWY